VEKRGIRAFWHRKGGQVAIIFALMLLPILVVVGFAVDASRQVTTKKTLQQATDMAALAAAKHYTLSGDAGASKDLSALVFNTNIKNVHSDVTCNTQARVPNATTLSFRFAARCHIPTIFGKTISGKDRMSVFADSTAEGSVTTLDLALVLDVSASMRGNRLRTLQTAASGLIDQLVTSDSRVRIALIPYGSGVNAGVYGNPALGRTVGDDTEGDGLQRVCVSERQGVEEFTDAQSLAGTRVGAPNNRTRGCPIQPIVPLSDNAETLKDQIDDFVGIGFTAGHIAVAWGWYSISPDWASVWPSDSRPRAYGNPDDLKVMILMTDGRFNLRSNIAQGTSAEQAEELCEGMRARGIIIFSIAFRAPPAGQNLMQNCATSPNHYYQADDNAALIDAYATIASRFQGVGLTE